MGQFEQYRLVVIDLGPFFGSQNTSNSGLMSGFYRCRGQLNHGKVSRTLKAMDVELTPEQKPFARRAIESGCVSSQNLIKTDCDVINMPCCRCISREGRLEAALAILLYVTKNRVRPDNVTIGCQNLVCRGSGIVQPSSGR